MASTPAGVAVETGNAMGAMVDVAYQHVAFVQDGPKAFLTFDRPDARNALNRRLIDEALDAVGRLSEQTRVLVVRGAGDRAFAAGADLSEMRDRTLWTDLPSGPRRELARRLENAPFPTVAALNGVALGGGLELALACHLRVASATARLGLPEIGLGILPGNGGTARLTRLVGRGRALQMMLLAEQIDAAEAHRIGLVNWVVPAAEFADRVASIADALAALPPVAAQAVLDCAIHAEDLTIDQAVDREHRWFQICLASPDKREAVAAFFEKRAPRFRGS